MERPLKLHNCAFPISQQEKRAPGIIVGVRELGDEFCDDLELHDRLGVAAKFRKNRRVVVSDDGILIEQPLKQWQTFLPAAETPIAIDQAKSRSKVIGVNRQGLAE